MVKAIIFSVIAILVGLARAGRKTKKREKYNKLSSSVKEKIESERLRKQQEADELVSVIIPTISNDK